VRPDVAPTETKASPSPTAPEGEDEAEADSSAWMRNELEAYGYSEAVAWSPAKRQLLSGIALAGVLETAFLTYAKVFASTSGLCGTAKCSDVLNSAYSSFLGVPLTVPAFFAYGLMLYWAARPLFASSPLPSETGGDGQTADGGTSLEYRFLDMKSRGPLMVLSTAMASFSAYLMGVLAFVLKDFCPFCLASAILSSLLYLFSKSWKAVPIKSRSQKFEIAATGSVFALSALMFLTTNPDANARLSLVFPFLQIPLWNEQPEEPFPSPLAVTQETFWQGRLTKTRTVYEPPPVIGVTSPQGERVAARLKQLGAKMYGAWWCSHCYHQKQVIGESFYKNVQYLECDADGANSQAGVCTAKDISGYPAWEINGQIFYGEKSLEQLELMTGMREPRDGEKIPKPGRPQIEPEPAEPQQQAQAQTKSEEGEPGSDLSLFTDAQEMEGERKSGREEVGLMAGLEVAKERSLPFSPFPLSPGGLQAHADFRSWSPSLSLELEKGAKDNSPLLLASSLSANKIA